MDTLSLESAERAQRTASVSSVASWLIDRAAQRALDYLAASPEPIHGASGYLLWALRVYPPIAAGSRESRAEPDGHLTEIVLLGDGSFQHIKRTSQYDAHGAARTITPDDIVAMGTPVTNAVLETLQRIADPVGVQNAGTHTPKL